jgi:hypothetical protein
VQRKRAEILEIGEKAGRDTGNGGEGKGDIVKIYLFATPWQSFC